MKSKVDNSILISIVASACFGIVNSVDMIAIEDLMTDEFKSNNYLTEIDIALIDDTLAGILTMVLTIFLQKYILHHLFSGIIKHPVFDAIGIILGTIIVIVISRYVVRKRYFKRTIDENERKKQRIHL
jgi:hypothetical protein